MARGSLVQKPISKNFTLSISGVKKHGLASPLKSATVFVSAHAVKAWAGSFLIRGEIRVNPSENLNKFSTNKKVAIISGGTSDLAVTLEAQISLEIYGVSCQSFIDVGVAGLHRLLNQIDEINKFDVLIVCAGMEGALATVIGGLLPQPIIAVPVSVGYGVSKNGETALNSMLSSCAPGISVMNIDNGYGAAMAALRIIKRIS